MSDYMKYQLGMLDRGSVVAVSLSTAANVRLMGSHDMSLYASGRSHSYYGGLARTSPYRIGVPFSGTWYVTVDLAGFSASSVRCEVKVIPPPERPAFPVPSREDGYYSEYRSNDDKTHYFVGRNGKPTSERPHVHVIHNGSENQITIVGTHRDGTHFSESPLPYGASAREVEVVVKRLRKLLR